MAKVICASSTKGVAMILVLGIGFLEAVLSFAGE